MQGGVEEKKTHPELENSKSLPVFENTMTATSESQRMESSWAFLNKPVRRLEKVTCLLLALSILLISIFPRPIEHAQLELSSRDYKRRSLRSKRKTLLGWSKRGEEKKKRWLREDTEKRFTSNDSAERLASLETATLHGSVLFSVHLETVSVSFLPCFGFSSAPVVGPIFFFFFTFSWLIFSLNIIN